MSYQIGTKDSPMVLKTPPLSSEYTMHVDQKDGKEILVCTVGKTVLHFNIDCLNDLHQMLKDHGDWMELGSADEQKPAKDGTVEKLQKSRSFKTVLGINTHNSTYPKVAVQWLNPAAVDASIKVSAWQTVNCSEIATFR